MRLYTYKIVVDQGAAPNPFHGSCTLAICKPVIRRMAKPGDWVVGIGSKQLGHPDKVIYAMQVERSLPIADYYNAYPEKRPDWSSGIFERQVGDAIYNLDDPKRPRLIKGVHTAKDMSRDLSGLNVLTSTLFYYFGHNAVSIPSGLAYLGEVNRGHRSIADLEQIKAFIDWIDSYPIGIQGIPIDGGDFLICQ
jgi:hypothetical protein